MSESAQNASPGEHPQPPAASDRGRELVETIRKREQRRLNAQRERHRSVWFGFGMFGMVGWSVMIPTVAGVALGCWLDRHYPARWSWCLMLLGAGICLGCALAMHWVRREGRLDE